MEVAYEGLGSHADERSRARAARGLAAMVQSRMAGAKHGPGDGVGIRP